MLSITERLAPVGILDRSFKLRARRGPMGDMVAMLVGVWAGEGDDGCGTCEEGGGELGDAAGTTGVT